MNCSAELETPFSQLSMNLNIDKSALRICPPLNLVFKIGHLLGGQILKSSLPFITMESPSQLVPKVNSFSGAFGPVSLVMHQSFVSTVPPPTGMGGDNDFSLFRALV